MALARAQQDDITGALDALDMDAASSEAARKLRGLCLFRLGDYANAAAVLAPYEEYREEAADAWARFQETAREVVRLVENDDLHGALALLRARTMRSVQETIMLGCLLALRGRKAAAARAFEEALSLDRGNRDAVGCLLALRDPSAKGWFTRLRIRMR